MSSTGQNSPSTSSTGPRVRPVTWAILAWMFVMIVCILAAWQGSEARWGRIPEVEIATGSETIDVPPYTAADLSGNRHSNPVPSLAPRGDQTLSVRLPVELRRTTLTVFEVRENGEREYEAPAGESPLLVPVTTDEGRLTGLAIQGLPGVFAADGSEDVLAGEWSVVVLPEPERTGR